MAVPRQIVDGKCRILRKEWFTTKYGSAGLGREESGNDGMSVKEVVTACASELPACAREDDSHGHWGTCEVVASGCGVASRLTPIPAPPSSSSPSPSPSHRSPSNDRDCGYFSFMYYRPDLSGDTGSGTANATYRKIQVLTLAPPSPPEESGSGMIPPQNSGLLGASLDGIDIVVRAQAPTPAPTPTPTPTPVPDPRSRPYRST